MKELITKSFIYNAFIEIKDSLMGKIWAFFFVKEYRKRVVVSVFVFGMTLFFLLDTYIINGTKLSVAGILALCGLLTFAFYCLIFEREHAYFKGLIKKFKSIFKKRAAAPEKKGAQK